VLAKLYQQYKERAEFYIIYIQEAHTSDGWHLPENIREKVIFAAPRNIEERSAVAGTCMLRLHIPIPGLIDNFRQHHRTCVHRVARPALRDRPERTHRL
jgi:hypothetical protein